MSNPVTLFHSYKVRHFLLIGIWIMAMLLPIFAHSSDSVTTLAEKETLTAEQTNVEPPTEASPVNEKKIQPAALAHDLSPWGMFNSADWVVKVVMIGLAIASLATWTVLVAKSFEFIAMKRLLRKNLTHLNHAHTLKDADNNAEIHGVTRELINAADTEIGLSKGLANGEDGKTGIKERAASSISRVQATSSRNMLTGTGLLATIGSVAPFVGLFGTVWGIMNSFIGIAQANTTNLAVVAPGIAEALLATALGLVAAIPAVVIYNHFSRQIAAAKALTTDNAEAILRIVSRDLDREKSLQVVRRKTGS